jgi:hypothetical protein
MIRKPTITNWKCAASAVSQPSPSTSSTFSATGSSTMKAAPAKLPKIELPSPPMMIMNSTRNDFWMP